MSLTTDPSDPRLKETGNDGQQGAYLVLSEEDRAAGFARPVREKYMHTTCLGVTTIPTEIAETFARDPKFYNGTFCATCKEHFPLSEFKWPDGVVVGE